MKKQLVCVVPALVAVALSASALSVSAQASGGEVVTRFVNARNQADEAGAMALVADEMSEGMQGDVRVFIADHAQSTLIGLPLVSGTILSGRAETSSDAARAAGVDRVVSNYTADVREGKLTSFRGIPDVSDPQTATYEGFQRAQQPVATLDLSARVHDNWAIPTPVLSAVTDSSTTLTLEMKAIPVSPTQDCWVPGDLVGDGNPAEVARTLCGRT